jgi:hypothetical protein
MAITMSDAFVAAVLVAAGAGVVGIMVYPMIGPRGIDRPPAAATIGDRWPPPLEKADRLAAPRVTDARPWGPIVGLQLQSESSSESMAPIEQAIERKNQDEEAERDAREYRRAAARRGLDEPRDVCARHGMRRHYFHRRHHLSWRCVGHGR